MTFFEHNSSIHRLDPYTWSDQNPDHALDLEMTENFAVRLASYFVMIGPTWDAFLQVPALYQNHVASFLYLYHLFVHSSQIYMRKNLKNKIA